MRQRGIHILDLCSCCFTGSLFHAQPVFASFLLLKSPNSKSISPYDEKLQLLNSALSPTTQAKRLLMPSCMKILCKAWQPLSEGACNLRCRLQESPYSPVWRHTSFLLLLLQPTRHCGGRLLYLHSSLECSRYGL